MIFSPKYGHSLDSCNIQLQKKVGTEKDIKINH